MHKKLLLPSPWNNDDFNKVVVTAQISKNRAESDNKIVNSHQSTT
jgi:hypothetical protein